jgi:hypothetical protein
MLIVCHKISRFSTGNIAALEALEPLFSSRSKRRVRYSAPPPVTAKGAQDAHPTQPPHDSVRVGHSSKTGIIIYPPVRFAQSKSGRARPPGPRKRARAFGGKTVHWTIFLSASSPRGRARYIAPTPACQSRSALHPGVFHGPLPAPRRSGFTPTLQPSGPHQRARAFDGQTALDVITQIRIARMPG